MRQIIAMGGGGFSMQPDNPLLDEYVLSQVPKHRPKVCFVPTASGDSESYVERFYAAFRNLDCEPSHLSLFRLPTTDLESFVLEKDILYVGGGNTKNLLALWRDWGLDSIMKLAWENGIVLAGVSAGSICWFEEGLTDSFGVTLDGLSCLGFLPGSNCPHYDGESERRPTFHRLLQHRRIGPGLAAEDGVAFHFIGTELKATVSSRPNARGYRLSMGENGVREEEIVPEYLGEMPSRNPDTYGGSI
ncbi:peptidase E [Alicyclobacillus sp. SO9]|uniref:Type 1 glutamine amidotransferase-like domain-containing protein n=1 Tax=Alicyclobacillus sp. SO9 TaxID=2665646 RepID=UPI0018E7EEF7|nr:peptidase E [Alicyclobacillus sp. SO9]QQE80493.1 peptidase E [Alicyclobacillus sp. SO9]